MKRIKEKDDSRNGWYEITPEEAAQMLGNGSVKNRTLSETNARNIADAIKQGRWTDTGETIILDQHGKLADGQHRLRACVLANKPISSMVVFMPARLGSGFFDGIDQGKSRSAADRLGMDGVKYATIAASVSRLLIVQNTPSLKGGGRHNAAWVRKTYEARAAEIDSSIEHCQGYFADIRGWLPTSVLVFCHMMASAVNQNKAADWTAGIATGENLDRNSPMYKARKILCDRSATTIKSRKYVLGILVKSWLYFLRGETPQMLYFRAEENVLGFDSAVSEMKKAAKGTQAKG